MPTAGLTLDDLMHLVRACHTEGGQRPELIPELARETEGVNESHLASPPHLPRAMCSVDPAPFVKHLEAGLPRLD
jgi:hypothetical protein